MVKHLHASEVVLTSLVEVPAAQLDTRQPVSVPSHPAVDLDLKGRRCDRKVWELRLKLAPLRLMDRPRLGCAELCDTDRAEKAIALSLDPHVRFRGAYLTPHLQDQVVTLAHVTPGTAKAAYRTNMVALPWG